MLCIPHILHPLIDLFFGSITRKLYKVHSCLNKSDQLLPSIVEDDLSHPKKLILIKLRLLLPGRAQNGHHEF